VTELRFRAWREGRREDVVVWYLREREQALSRRRGGSEATDADYKLLGLASSPPPSSSAIRAAFRAQAMLWHPDLAAGRSEEEREACHTRFQQLAEAHRRLQAAHPEYLEGDL